MIDILTGRCTQHGWLSDAECKAGYCLKCDGPDVTPHEDEEPDEDFWEMFYADV